MEKEELTIKIPFGKAARIGNFKIWRSRVEQQFTPQLSEEQKEMIKEGKARPKKQKADIEAINVSNLDGTWMIRIPQTYEMFGMITCCYQWSQSRNPEDRERGVSFLSTALSNMIFCSTICNGFYHQALKMIATAYAHPSLLSDKKQRKDFDKEAKDLIKRFLDWRVEYERHLNEQELSDKELERDAKADAMREELAKAEEGEKNEA